MVQKVASQQPVFYQNFRKELAKPDVTSNVKFKNTRFSNTTAGQALSGNLLDKKPVRDFYQKAFGVEFQNTGSNVQISGKKLTKDSMKTLKKEFNLTQKEANALRKNGKIIVKNQESVANLITAKGNTALQKAGFELSEDGILRISKDALDDTAKAWLKNSGVTDDLIKEIAEKGTANLGKESVQKLVASAGKNEIAAIIKQTGAEVSDNITTTVTAKSAKWAEKLGDDAARLCKTIGEKAPILKKGVNKLGELASKVPILKKAGEKISEKIAGRTAGEVAGKLVSKVGATSAKGCAGIPVVGALIMGAFELPSIIKAFKDENGKFSLSGGLAQIGRSALKVGASLGASGLGAAIGQALIPIPFLGAAIGAVAGEIIGGIVGYSAGEKVGNAIFGKSLADKQKDAAKSAQVTQPTTQGNETQSSALGTYMTDTNFMNAPENPYRTMYYA